MLRNEVVFLSQVKTTMPESNGASGTDSLAPDVEAALRRAQTAGIITSYSYEASRVHIKITDARFTFWPREAVAFVERLHEARSRQA